MDEPTTLSNPCPSGEELSAWYDSELRDARLDTHIAGCAQCQAAVKTYRQLDQRIQGNLATVGGDTTAVRRIKRQSLDRIQANQERHVLLSFWGRVAALAAAACVLMAALIYVRDYLASREERNAVPLPLPPTAWSPAEVRLLAGAANDEPLQPLAGAVPMPPATPLVLQRWTSADPAAAVTVLAALVAPDAGPALSAFSRRAADRYTFELLLPGARLQGLVNRLDAKGLKLEGETKPRPGEAVAPTPELKPVRYRVDFVRR